MSLYLLQVVFCQILIDCQIISPTQEIDRDVEAGDSGRYIGADDLTSQP